MLLRDIKQGLRLSGIVTGELISVVNVQPFGEDAIELIYRKNDGTLGQQLFYYKNYIVLMIMLEHSWQTIVNGSKKRKRFRIK